MHIDNELVKKEHNMKLNEILSKVKILNIVGNNDVEITGVNIDSRRIENGHLFVAIRGTQVDIRLFKRR